MDRFDETTIEEVEALNESVHLLMRMVSALPNQAGDALLERPRHITIAYAEFRVGDTVMILYSPRDDLYRVVNFDIRAPSYYLHASSYDRLGLGVSSSESRNIQPWVIGVLVTITLYSRLLDGTAYYVVIAEPMGSVSARW